MCALPDEPAGVAMADSEGTGHFGVSHLVTLGKDTVGLLRDAALLVLVILLLIFPASLNDVLVRAGFEEGSLAGFKWKKQLVQSDKALVDANATISDLKSQLEKTSNALSEAQARIDDQGLRASLSKLATENQQVGDASAKVQASAQSTIASGASLVDKAQAAMSSKTSWAVVFGGDVSVNAAQDEIDRAVKRGIGATAILFRQGSYRSVAFADSRSDAEQILGLARTFRSDAYVVSMSSWCPQRRDNGTYSECVPSS